MTASSPREVLKLLGIPEDLIHMQDRKYYDHLLSVYAALTVWGMPMSVRMAGLLHSIYGTQRFTGFHLPPDDRKKVSDVVGSEAEVMAYASCMIRREEFDAYAPLGHRRFESRFGGDIVFSDEEEFDNFCTIHLCDWLDQVEMTGEWDYRFTIYRWIASRLGGAPLEAFKWVYRRILTCSQTS